MPSMTRRSAFAAFAAAFVAPLVARAQGPAGAGGSTTAPSNSEGTPAGGAGTVSNTRVGPSSKRHRRASGQPRHRATKTPSK